MTMLEKDRQYVWHPYTQAKTAPSPLPIVKGEGAVLIDEEGNTYIDAISSWWVNLHGHSHPYIAEKIYEQLLQLEHVIFAGFTHPTAVNLAERLIQWLPSNQGKVFFSDNGSTAVEIGIKMAIQFYHNQGIKRHKLVAFENAFHGETFGTMSVSGKLSLNNAFEDHLFEILRIPPPLPGQEQKSLEALEQILEKELVYAFLFEPLIMGAGGMLMYQPEELDKLISKCKEKEVLCIADEVMTGFGRTGKLFASDYLQNPPDIMCLSKGITGGTLPLAVTTCTDKIFEAFLSEDKYKTFFHGHSYTGNPVGCAAALASLDLTTSENCRKQLNEIGQLHGAFKQKIADHAAVKDVRQRGTILAIEFKTAETTSYFNSLRDRLYDFFLEKGILLRPLGNVIYIMPPYCITKQQLEKVYHAIEEALDQLGENS